VLAAGLGTRMRSRRHKVLHPLGGKPLILRVLDLLTAAGVERTVVVLGHLADQVEAVLPAGVVTVEQQPPLGTGHAVQVAADRLRELGVERLLVHYGDEALVRVDSLRRLGDEPVGPELPISLLTARLANPTGYGRVLRGATGSVVGMVEEKDATPEQRAVDEIWSGSMLIWTPWLWRRLGDLPRSPGGEYYLPDLVNLALADDLDVSAVTASEEDEVRGINDRAQLAEANAILRRRTIAELQRQGVTIVDPASTFVEPEVRIAADVTVHPGCHLVGQTRIDADCEIGPNTMLVDTEVGAGSRVRWSVLEGARVGRDVDIGPFSHLRPGALIEDRVELGNYAEVKASRIGADSKMHHVSYVGDADVGTSVNIAAGSITCNYDAETSAKRRTVIEDGAALGSDTLLVAPVTVGARALTGAGSVVTHDVPADELWQGVPARFARRRREPDASELSPSQDDER
jgi:bifunctional UDP-N-acetylglucosamine pyrophosphorylase / glucosamine-1-phosphate N-acetyltransferase